MKPLFIYAILLTLLLSCQGESASSKNVQNQIPTQRFNLYGGFASVALPIYFKASSRYRAKEDLSNFLADSTALLLFQQNLEMMEFEDKDIDIFVDSLNKFDHLIIFDMEHMSLNKTSGTLLNKQLNDNYDLLSFQMPELSIEKVESSFKKNNKFQYFKYKHKITNTLHGVEFYTLFYVISTQLRTYAIREVSAGKEDLEDFLSSWRD